MIIYFYADSQMFLQHRRTIATWEGPDVQVPRRDDFVKIGTKAHIVRSVVWRKGSHYAADVYCSPTDFTNM